MPLKKKRFVKRMASLKLKPLMHACQAGNADEVKKLIADEDVQ